MCGGSFDCLCVDGTRVMVNRLQGSLLTVPAQLEAAAATARAHVVDEWTQRVKVWHCYLARHFVDVDVVEMLNCCECLERSSCGSLVALIVSMFLGVPVSMSRSCHCHRES